VLVLIVGPKLFIEPGTKAIVSAGQEYLSSALTALRRLHPEVKTKLLDLTTGEQIMALRRGEIDLALTYLGRDFALA